MSAKSFPRALSAEARHDLFLIVKEAFHNILKHARASQVRVQLSASPTGLEMLIEDNGCGFDPARIAADGKGNGLRNIHKRVEALRGHLVFSTSPGQGTQIKVTVPLS